MTSCGPRATRAAARDFLRAAVLAWSALRAAALSIRRTSVVCSLVTFSAFAAVHALRQPSEVRLDLGAVAQVLETLPLRDQDALLLLLDVRHCASDGSKAAWGVVPAAAVRGAGHRACDDRPPCRPARAAVSPCRPRSTRRPRVSHPRPGAGDRVRAAASAPASRRTRSPPPASPPDTVRSLVADAALGASFIPVFNELLERGEDRRAWRVASTAITVATVGLSIVTALGIVFAEPIVELLPLQQASVLVTSPSRSSASSSRSCCCWLPYRARQRDPDELRRVHGAGARTRGLEPRDHRVPVRRLRLRRPGLSGRALRLGLAGGDRRAVPAAAAVAARARRAADHQLGRARPGPEARVHADAADHDRARA